MARRDINQSDGFFLDQNTCDAVYLDGIIFQELSPADQAELKQRDYYGYVLNATTVPLFELTWLVG